MCFSIRKEFESAKGSSVQDSSRLFVRQKNVAYSAAPNVQEQVGNNGLHHL
jgi:hypothetical protein